MRALEDTTVLGAVSLEVARPDIVRELSGERRAEAYAAWTIRELKAAESRLVCERDRLPERGVVVLSSFAPFLSLHETGIRELGPKPAAAPGSAPEFASANSVVRPEAGRLRGRLTRSARSRKSLARTGALELLVVRSSGDDGVAARDLGEAERGVGAAEDRSCIVGRDELRRTR